MKSHCEDVFDRLVPEACVELFASVGVSLRRIAPGSSGKPIDESELVAGSIPFESELVRGTLTLLATPQLLEKSATTPLPKRPLTEAVRTLLHRDWAASSQPVDGPRATGCWCSGWSWRRRPVPVSGRRERCSRARGRSMRFSRHRQAVVLF